KAQGDLVIDKVHGIVGDCDGIKRVFTLIEKAAKTAVNVLISGESGTGKELVARAIHFHSQRASRPFIRVNCAALPETLIESELFGHVRGAFTGAVRDRKGRFAQAQSGTILLDEVGALPLASQAKFLRVLQEKEFEPVGSSESVKVDVRVIATNNSDLAMAVHDGVFREDLYYRLSVFPIAVASLRERREDVPLLGDHFLRKYVHLNRSVRHISPEALKIMVEYHWPGNVRQLENAVQHALIVETTNVIQHISLPLPLRSSAALTTADSQPQRLRDKIIGYERQLILDALAQSYGRKKKAAQLLGIDPKNLSHLLHKHHL
ncbi:sigma 54-interacting transcriptional regulator, partial [bacterium]|nr:sigma 54-interacting transcriptional regulator [bacterium]